MLYQPFPNSNLFSSLVTQRSRLNDKPNDAKQPHNRRPAKSIGLKSGIVIGMMILLSACANQVTLKPENSTSLQQHNISLSPLSDWGQRKFTPSVTNYSLSIADEQTVLTAHSASSASMLYQKIQVDLNKTPYFNWRWQVENTFPNNKNEQKREGDDFPARVYIAIKPASLEIKPRAISYVWASHAKQFSTWPSPFNNNVMTLALQSGDAHAGQWQSEKRNLKEDIQQLFGMPIEMVEGIAIMSDTDNTDNSTVAHYQRFFFSAE